MITATELLRRFVAGDLNPLQEELALILLDHSEAARQLVLEMDAASDDEEVVVLFLDN